MKNPQHLPVACIRKSPHWRDNCLGLASDHPEPIKTATEREFSLRMAVCEQWGKRKVERKLRGALFESIILDLTTVVGTTRQAE